MIRLTTREHGTTSPISATELKTVLDDASYLHLERHPFGPLPEYERRVRTDAEPAFTVYKMAADDGFAIQVRASYFIGVDWVIPGAVSILVLPKVERLDMPAMLKRVLGVADAVKEFDGLLSVRHWEKPIPDAEDCDRFLLFVAAAFLKITQRIVRKGLLKSFRTEEEIFRYRVKGKLRVSDTLRKMRFGDPFARAVCSPQSFDDDTPANRFLKLVLRRMHSVLAARSKALGAVAKRRPPSTRYSRNTPRRSNSVASFFCTRESVPSKRRSASHAAFSRTGSTWRNSLSYTFSPTSAGLRQCGTFNITGCSSRAENQTSWWICKAPRFLSSVASLTRSTSLNTSMTNSTRTTHANCRGMEG